MSMQECPRPESKALHTTILLSVSTRKLREYSNQEAAWEIQARGVQIMLNIVIRQVVNSIMVLVIVVVTTTILIIVVNICVIVFNYYQLLLSVSLSIHQCCCCYCCVSVTAGITMSVTGTGTVIDKVIDSTGVMNLATIIATIIVLVLPLLLLS